MQSDQIICSTCWGQHKQWALCREYWFCGNYGSKNGHSDISPYTSSIYQYSVSTISEHVNHEMARYSSLVGYKLHQFFPTQTILRFTERPSPNNLHRALFAEHSSPNTLYSVLFTTYSSTDAINQIQSTEYAFLSTLHRALFAGHLHRVPFTEQSLLKIFCRTLLTEHSSDRIMWDFSCYFFISILAPSIESLNIRVWEEARHVLSSSFYPNVSVKKSRIEQPNLYRDAMRVL